MTSYQKAAARGGGEERSGGGGGGEEKDGGGSTTTEGHRDLIHTQKKKRYTKTHNASDGLPTGSP